MTKAYKPLPAAEELWDLFDYKPLTGELVWKTPTSPRNKPGTIAGYKTNRGYLAVSVRYEKYLCHRIVWAWVYGIDPGESELDHKDRNKSNNTISNLRLATHQQNSMNISVRSDNSTGYTGVIVKSSGNFQSRIRVNGKVIHLGTFTTAAEAAKVRKAAAIRLHGEFARV